jgi:UDP-2,3-diacylglucosamine pyrophosphatase LpxH
MNPQFTASSKMLFLSDVHLGAFTPRKNRQLEEDVIRLIEFAGQNNYHIIILGDLFDYWIEYSSAVPLLGNRMLQCFHHFNQASPALYITGNHDNWTLGYFAKLGFDVESNYRLYPVKDKHVLLLHGDATGPDLYSLERPFWHRVIRNRLFLKIYRSLLPPEAGLYVMKKFSEMNRQTGQENDHTELDGWAKAILKGNSVDMILCGHDHVPRIRAYDGGIYINAGSFSDHRSLITYNKGNFDLVKWHKEKSTFTPFSITCEAV